MDQYQAEDKDGFYNVVFKEEGVESVTIIPSASATMYANNHCNNVTMDGTFTCFDTMKVLIAVMRDGNGKIQMIGAMICDAEDKANSKTFLHNLNMYVFNDTPPNVLADRGVGLEAAMNEIYGDQVNCCIQHFSRNVDSKGSQEKLPYKTRKIIDSLLKEAAYTSNTSLFIKAMGRIQQLSEEIHDYIVDTNEIWCNISSVEETLGFRTSNNAETSIHLLKSTNKTHGQQILSQDLFNMTVGIISVMMEQHLKRKEEVSRLMNGSTSFDIIAESVYKKICSQKSKVDTIYNKCSIEDSSVVLYGGHRHRVSLSDNYCTCNEYSSRGYPCIHALILLKYLNKDLQQHEVAYVHPYYRLSQIAKTIPTSLPYVNPLTFSTFNNLKQYLNEHNPNVLCSPYLNNVWELYYQCFPHKKDRNDDDHTGTISIPSSVERSPSRGHTHRKSRKRAKPIDSDTVDAIISATPSYTSVPCNLIMPSSADAAANGSDSDTANYEGSTSDVIGAPAVPSTHTDTPVPPTPILTS